MSNENKDRKLTKIQENPGLFSGMSRTLRLVLRLLADRRVNFFLKLLPIGSLVYLFSPLDAAIPLIDDAVIVGLGTYVFIELCPQDVVEEHQARLAGHSETPANPTNDPEVVDASFTEINKE